MAGQFTSVDLTDNLGPNSEIGAQTSTTVSVANPLRKGFMIQNQSTSVMYINFGPTAASSSNYIAILKACGSTADGTGGSFSMLSGIVWRGAITTNGSGSYSFLEF